MPTTHHDYQYDNNDDLMFTYDDGDDQPKSSRDYDDDRFGCRANNETIDCPFCKSFAVYKNICGECYMQVPGSWY